MNDSLKKVEVVSYNPDWLTIYEKEAVSICDELKDHVLAIEHIGSTSVKGLIAKPKIDILLVVDDLKNSALLKDLGYTCNGELNIPLRYYFRRKSINSKYNLHVVPQGHGFIQLNLLFRNALRNDRDAFEEYAALKNSLSKDPANAKKQVSFFTGYNLAKDTFIKKTLRKVGFQGYSVSFCMHTKEWARFEEILNRSREELEGDPYSLKEPREHYYFVLYKGADVVAAAHYQKNLQVQSIASDPHCGNIKDHTFLKSFIESWVKASEFKK